MSNVLLFPKQPSNHVFEAYDEEDPTKHYFLWSFRDEEDTGVHVEFVDPAGPDGSHRARDRMWLNAEQCEEFGSNLLKAAAIIRAADAADPNHTA